MTNTGDAAKRFSALSDQQLIDSAMATIKKWYPNAPNCVNFKRSNGGSDLYAGGAWTYIRLGSSDEDCDAYYESESTGKKVFFAGEGTDSIMLGTVHGAYQSGIDAATDALNSFPCAEGDEAEAEAEEELAE